jgi:hypothetical protein
VHNCNFGILIAKLGRGEPNFCVNYATFVILSNFRL